MRKLMVVGNWKMNLTSATAELLASQIRDGGVSIPDSVGVVLCPAFPYLVNVRDVIRGSNLQLGAQDVSANGPGAYTGETAAEMLLDVGCSWTIIGHSERRTYHQESDVLVNKKVHRALEKGLSVFLCVGENKDERQSGLTESVLERQMTGSLANIAESATARIVIAYEPVWAIGTGLVATNEQAEAAHSFLRGWLRSRFSNQVSDEMRILYGGSVKADNALGLLSQPNVDGALVGGASLDAKSFVSIVQSAEKSFATK